MPRVQPAYYYMPAQPQDYAIFAVNPGVAQYTVDGAGQVVGAKWWLVFGDNVTYTNLNVAQNSNIVVEAGGTATFTSTAHILEGGHALASYGSITLLGGTLIDQAFSSFGVYTNNANIGNGGVLWLQNSGYNFIAGISNAGTIKGDGTLNFYSFANNGVVEAQGGALKITGPVDVSGTFTGFGHFQIDSNSTLALQNPTSQSINFTGPNETLAVPANTQTGLIVNLANSDTLDIVNSKIGFLAASYSGGETTLQAYSGTTLAETFTLEGQYSPASFSLAADGHGGTNITAIQPTTASDPSALSAAHNQTFSDQYHAVLAAHSS